MALQCMGQMLVYLVVLLKSRTDKDGRERIMNSFPPFTFVAKSDERTLEFWKRDEMLSPSIFEIEWLTSLF
jgi:hypothetical protein